MLSVAKTAVRVSARLAARVQVGVSSITKADTSPVTVADFASQAAVALILIRELHGIDAARTLLSGGSVGGFSMLGEEDASALSGADAQSTSLLACVVNALASALPPRAEFLDGALLTGGILEGCAAAQSGWRGEDVLAAISAGGGPDAPRSTDAGFWVLDPIDGTKGFLRGGQWAVGLAFVSGGAPTLAAIACPPLGFPACSLPRGGDAPSRAVDRMGSLLAAGAGVGATCEYLWDDTAGGAGAAAGGAATRLASDVSVSDADLVICGSYAHNAAGDLDNVATAMGGDVTRAPPIRIDSMAKYALVARRDADAYVRLPQANYYEKVWDHAPGSLIVQEAGGVVTDCLGSPLDFTVGANLAKNAGVVASATAAIHARAVAATRAHIEKRHGSGAM